MGTRIDHGIAAADSASRLQRADRLHDLLEEAREWREARRQHPQTAATDWEYKGTKGHQVTIRIREIMTSSSPSDRADKRTFFRANLAHIHILLALRLPVSLMSSCLTTHRTQAIAKGKMHIVFGSSETFDALQVLQ